MPLPLERVLASQRLAQGPAGFQPAPFQFALTGEDNIRISTINSAPGVSMLLTGRWLKDGDPAVSAFARTFPLQSAGTEQAFDLFLGAGTLLNLAAVPFGDVVAVGQCFVRVDVVRGTGARLLVGTLIAGYTGSWGGRAWPGTPLQHPWEGPGFVRRVTGTTNGAGTEFAVSGDLNSRWRVKSVKAKLTSSAAVATRTPLLKVNARGGTVHWSQSVVDQPASSAYIHSWIAGAAPPVLAVPIIGGGALPAECDIAGDGFTIPSLTSTTSGLQAGDAWSEIDALVEEWRYPPTIFAANGLAP